MPSAAFSSASAAKGLAPAVTKALISFLSSWDDEAEKDALKTAEATEVECYIRSADIKTSCFIS